MDGRKEAFAGDQRQRKDETKRKEGGNELDTEVSLYRTREDRRRSSGGRLIY